jgi:hypothetical protein
MGEKNYLSAVNSHKRRRSKKKKKLTRPGMMAYICYHSYSGGRGWKDHNFRPAQAKERQQVPISIKK